MANRTNEWLWQFKKIDGRWHRRPANSNDRWQALVVRRVAWPAEPRNDSRERNKELIAPPQLNEWTWR